MLELGHVEYDCGMWGVQKLPIQSAEWLELSRTIRELSEQAEETGDKTLSISQEQAKRLIHATIYAANLWGTFCANTNVIKSHAIYDSYDLSLELLKLTNGHR